MNPESFQNKTSKETLPGMVGRFLHGENHTLAYWEGKAGTILPIHEHMHEQMTYVISGQLEMEVNGVKHIMNAHDVLLIPPHTPHGGRIIEDLKLIDSFSPVREDYKF